MGYQRILVILVIRVILFNRIGIVAMCIHLRVNWDVLRTVISSEEWMQIATPLASGGCPFVNVAPYRLTVALNFLTYSACYISTF